MGRPRGARPHVLAGVVVTLGGCALFPSLAGFSGGASDGGADSGAPGDASDSGVVDTGMVPRDSGVADTGSVPADSGAVDTGSVSADSGVVPCSQAGPTVLLCEDFESGTLDASTWPNHKQENGTSIVDNVRPHRGQYSFHCTTDAVNSGAPTIDTSIINFAPRAVSPLYVRAYVYVSAAPPASDPENIGGVYENVMPYPGATLALFGDALAVDDYAGSGNIITATAPAFPIDQWVCLQWTVTTGTNGTFAILLDDAGPFSSGDAGAFPSANAFAFGSSFYPAMAPQPSYDLFYDDIFVASTPVSCAE